MTQLRINIGGNYIYHYPNEPDFFIEVKPLKVATVDAKTGDKSPAAPWVLHEAEKRLTEFYSNPAKLPLLNYIASSMAAYSGRGASSNMKPRQMSSAGREACVRVGLVLIRYCDLASLRVGRPTDKGFKPISVSHIAYLSRMTKRRCERALSKLMAAGFIESQRRSRTNDEGEVRAEIAIRSIRPAFFISLGIKLKHLNNQRNRASERHKRRARRLDRSVTQLMAALGAQRTATKKKNTRQDEMFAKPTRKANRVSYDEKVSAVAGAYMAADSSLSKEDAFLSARKSLPRLV